MSTHIEEFAQRLRFLKERSGRSYGTLAARLHVSTSTLHRYCNGAAVPAEYAPVERFARQCGADARELVALHQLWLLADAARRLAPNRPPGPASEAPKPAGVEPPGPEGTAAPAAPAEGDPTDASPPLVDMPSAPPRRASRWSRRRIALVLLAAAAVLAAALPPTLRTLHAGEHPRALPPPLQVTVLSDNWDTQCDQWFLLRQPPARVPPLPSPQRTNAWVAGLGGVPAQDLRLQLTAQAKPGEPIVLHALYVKVVSSAAAPAENGYTLSSGCGGGLDPSSFAVDLDASVPRARAVSGFKGGDREAVVDFPLQVSATDAEVLNLDAHTLDHDVSWYLYLVWSSGTRQGTLRIDDHGHPFRTVGLKGDPLYFYSGTSWISLPQPDNAQASSATTS